MAKKNKKTPGTTADPSVIPVSKNKKARFKYEVLETLEAGLVLRGTEVKSLRDGEVSLDEAFVKFQEGEAFLIECTIPEFRQGNIFNHAPKRARKLLLHRREIERLREKVRQKGLTVVPLTLYFRSGRAKCEIALVRGKRLHDKRDQERSKEAAKEMRAAAR